MSIMKSFQAISLAFIMFMIIGMVNGRWLEVNMFRTSMISDGVLDNISENPPNLRMVVSNLTESTTMLYTEKRCQSIYGFLPCADTMQEGVFLMLMYTYLMMLGEGCIKKGSPDLVMLLGNGKFGANIFRGLMALPRFVIVVVSGFLATTSDAQNQVAFGVGMYAGSTVITLTLIWGLRIILSQDKLRGKSSTKDKQKLSVLRDMGVDIDEATGQLAIIMLLSLIPFATVQLVTLVTSPGMILLSLIVSSVSLFLFFAYQIWNPLIKNRSLKYLRQENLRIRFIYHIQTLAEEDDLIDVHGEAKSMAFERIFKEADSDNDDSISLDELENLIKNMFELEKDNISTEYAKAEILTHFDSDKSGKINQSEFQKGCTKWLKKWNNNSELVNNVPMKRKRANLTMIEKIMPEILKQVLEKHELVTEDGKPNREKIESDQEIHRDELKEFIETLQFGDQSLDHNTVLDEVINDFDNDTNVSIKKKEFVDGFIKWIEKAINHDPTIKDPKHAINKFEQDTWVEIDAPMEMEHPIESIMYVVFGVCIIYLISGAFVQSVVQFSNAAHMPFLFTSFVMVPVAMKTKMIIMALLEARSHVSKNASLSISEIYSGLVMDNLMGLTTLLATVYIKGLLWSYSVEVLAIMIPCIIVGSFAVKRYTYPLWASICAMLLYPVSVYLYYILEG